MDLSKAQVKTIQDLPTKSAQIRYLAALDMSRGDIARYLTSIYGKEVRYQHVRNVLITPVKTPKV